MQQYDLPIPENRIVLVGGGVRSGKSAFALELAHRLGKRRVFIATATAFDDEMKSRIERHQRERRDEFTTVEEPIELSATLDTLTSHDVVVVDCLTLWLSNLLLHQESVEAILARVDDVVRILKKKRWHAVLVTNEVGMSVHPPTPLGRTFVEVAGWTHQRIARVADEIYLAVVGTTLKIKPPSI
ncbi:MAG TPA: bifunctional adenosylcobinamide kinase/adenosylcobinamide-phosphate guanylyltransferase [Polyangiaceae bacterium]|jgi:adenosylcobinamide kinase/adenosylcobinamide-phosphate guanylyltransferase|nr:bifunctional adenosylcobinamide kinase/adenosylcobinamide-phosphate guanylyltransferase [Polyangiaceae bacterium]